MTPNPPIQTALEWFDAYPYVKRLERRGSKWFCEVRVNAHCFPEEYADTPEAACAAVRARYEAERGG